MIADKTKSVRFFFHIVYKSVYHKGSFLEKNNKSIFKFFLPLSRFELCKKANPYFFRNFKMKSSANTMKINFLGEKN